MITLGSHTLCPVCLNYISQDDLDDERSKSKMGRVHPYECKGIADAQVAEHEADLAEEAAHHANQQERDQ